MAFELVCMACGARYDDSRYRVSCETCEGLLEIEYGPPLPGGARVVPSASRLARYAATLPIRAASNMVTLGEGDTPILRLERLGRLLGVDLYAKLEYLNPTGSFKDRGNAVQVTVLKETGVEAVVDSATGNAGHSTAAYCARAGIRYIGFAEAEARDIKLQAITYHGTEIHRVDGDKEARREAARKFSENTGILFLDYGRNAYFIEGQKTLAYEVAEQMDPLPDHVVAPVGNGSILLALRRGFKDMVEDGRLHRLPQLHAAQVEAFQPLLAAYSGREWVPQPGAASVAIGVAISKPPRLERLVQACRESGGRPVAVSDEAVLVWQARLASQEGVLVEATSAVALGAVEVLAAQGAIAKGERVLVPLTGFGTKEPIPVVQQD